MPNQRIDSYVTLDTRLAWKPRRDLELSLVGQNLVADRHQEFGTVAVGSVTPTVVECGFYGNVRWSF
jgi:iron complex outermembrane receptor protein